MAGIIPVLPMAQDNIPQLHDYLPDNLYKYLMVIVVVANLLLRIKTNKGLEEK